MFNKSKQEADMDRPVSSGNQATIICADTTFTGDITTANDIRIDGTIKGNIDCTAKVIVGGQGTIEGDITCTQADVMGKVSGTVRVKELLHLRNECILNGNIYATKLHVDPSATFNGSCHMGANVVGLNTTTSSQNEKVKVASK